MEGKGEKKTGSRGSGLEWRGGERRGGDGDIAKVRIGKGEENNYISTRGNVQAPVLLKRLQFITNLA